MERPETTLFLLMSADGKISTGDTQEMDVDKDYPTIEGVKEGLRQYYELEKETDEYSLNSGKVLAKVGVNEGKAFQSSSSGVPIYFIVIDNEPNLTVEGVSFLLEKGKGVFLVTTNKNHPAHKIADTNADLKIISYDGQINFIDMFEQLKNCGVDKVTIQTGGTLNAEFARQGLVDHVSLVIAPLLVGGKNTPTLMDGKSLHNTSELAKLRPLKLKFAKELEGSYLHLYYDVIN